MSLFGSDEYQWRETYFVLFDARHHPSAEDVVKALTEKDERFKVSDARADEQGRLESLTVRSPDDFSAMDISFVSGEEVTEQIEELTREMSKMTLTDEERAKLKRLSHFNARFDVFHFEEVSQQDEDDGFLDPAALLIVMERLAHLSQGVAIDPQSGLVM